MFNQQPLGSSLSNFPILIILNSSSFNYARARNDGYDMRFIDSDDATVLSYEKEKWVYNGQSYIWVKVPNIPASSLSDYIWLYYGYNSAANGENKESVWDSNYVGVWHLSESSGNTMDSTANNNDGVTARVTQNVAGQVDGAAEWIGTNGYNESISLPNNALNNIGQGVVEFWFKADDTGDAWQNMWASDGSGSGWDNTIELGFETTNKASVWTAGCGAPGDIYYGVTLSNPTAWHYYSWLVNTTGNYLFIDGIVGGSSGSTCFFDDVDEAATTYYKIGCLSTSSATCYTSEEYNGKLDEVRVSKTPRSGAWIDASYLTMKDQFHTLGNEEVYSSDMTSVSYSIDANNRDAWDDASSGSLNSARFSDTDWNDVGGYQFKLNIPKGATINSANLRLMSQYKSGANNPYTVGIHVQDTGNAPVFTGAVNNIYSRSYWSTLVSWNIPSTGLPVDSWSLSPDITALVQHIIDRPDWAANNYIGLAVWGQTSAGASLEGIYDYSSSSLKSAKLDVTYTGASNTAPIHDVPTVTPASPGDNNDLTCNWNNVYDAEGDSVRNITTWYRNGLPVSVLYMPFEGNNGNEAASVKDYSGNGKDGTPIDYTLGNGDGNTPPLWSMSGGKVGGAYTFDGTDDYVRIPDSNILDVQTGDFTVSAWYNQPNSKSGIMVNKDNCGNSGGWYLAVEWNGQAYFRLIGSTDAYVWSGSATTANVWHHAVFVKEGTAMRLYLDGSLKDTDTAPSGIIATNNDVLLGNRYGSIINPSGCGNYWYSGILDEVKIYNIALSQEQVSSEYQAGLSGHNSNVFVSQETVLGEQWQCQVTPNDGYLDGTLKSSNTVTISSSTAPTHDNPYITPVSPSDISDLTCNWNNVVDANGDSVRNITAWYRNGLPVSALYLPFEGNNGNEGTTAKDYSGNGKNGVVSGATWSRTGGRIGGGYSFDGSDYIDTSLDLSWDETNSVSISFWANPDNIVGGDRRGIFGKPFSNWEWAIYQYNDVLNLVYWNSDGGHTNGMDFAASNVFAANTWVHITYTWDGSESKFYKNGNLAASHTATDPTINQDRSNYVKIGGNIYVWIDSYFRGKIDEVKIRNFALSQEQILSDYQAGLSGHNSNNFVSEETTLGEQWQCRVTPNDGYLDGTLKSSNTVTISSSTAPTHDNPYITPVSPSDISDLTCNWNNVVDVNGDPVTNITTWYKDGLPVNILYMPFEGNNGNEATNAKDYSGNGNDGAVAGTTWSRTGGKVGGAYSFDGNDYIDTPIVIGSDTSFSMMGWYKTSDITTRATIMGNQDAQAAGSSDGCTIYVQNGFLRVVCCDETRSQNYLASSTTINTWHFAAVTYDYSTNNLTLYQDSASVSTTMVGYSDEPGTDWEIGRNFFGFWYFNGLIDEVKIFNYALSGNQINSIYQAESQSRNPSMYVSEETSIGENWQCRVTPNDGYLDGIQKNSNTVTISAGNTAPTHDNPYITPGSPGAASDLTCNWNNVYDVNGDPVSNITAWYRDGSPVSVLYMPFEGNNGNEATSVRDYSGNGNDGAVNGATWSRTGGKVGGGYEFDGNNDYITIGTGSDFSDVCTNGCSFSAWINKNDNDMSAAIIGRYDFASNNQFFLLTILNNANAYFAVTENGTGAGCVATGDGSFTNNEWHHVVGIYDNTNTYVYIDGNIADSTSCSFNSIDEGAWQDNENTFVGLNDDDGFFNDFNGTIDEIQIYNYALSPEQILSQYQAGLSGHNSNVLVSDETTLGDQWQCRVTPNDGYVDGTLKSSNIVTVSSPVVTDESLKVYNFGQTGFTEVNVSYTSIRTVYLGLNYSDTATVCRYINHDNPYEAPEFPPVNTNWTSWEPCVPQKYWQLTENDGIKTVYGLINHSSGLAVLLNDSINYNSSGIGLDVSPPSAPIVIDQGFTNDVNNIILSWYGAEDYESVDVLGIPLLYQIQVFINEIFNQTIETLETEIFITNIGPGLSHGDNVTFIVTAINSGGLTNSTETDGLIIDLESPNFIQISSAKFWNRTAQSYDELDSVSWFDTDKILFEGVATDLLSGIYAFSFILSKTNVTPDQIPEGAEETAQSLFSHNFSNVVSGAYYFNVRARDAAGNWGGDYGSFFAKIDNTPPTRPEIIDTVFNAVGKNITYFWSESEDISGISSYMVNLTYENGSYYKSQMIYDTENRSCTFENIDSDDFATVVGAENGAGLWRWSNQIDISIDTAPPVIIKKSPVAKSRSISPVIAIWTDEIASCEYKIGTGNYSDFDYTNSTLHEAKILVADKIPATIDLRCTDLYDNSMTDLFSFDVDSDAVITEISPIADIHTFIGIETEIDFTLKSGSDLISQIGKDKVSFSLDGLDYGYNIVDNGDGSYTITFLAPDEPKIYPLKIRIDNALIEIDCTVDSLSLILGIELLYNENITVMERLILAVQNFSTFGFASSDPELSKSYSGNKLNLVSDVRDESFIFLTKKNVRFEGKDNELKKETFLEQKLSHFGYSNENANFLYLILSYSDLTINTAYRNNLNIGSHKLVIKNQKSPTSETELIITDDMSYAEKNVFKYD
ncbi:MAG: DUF2341 domain-containing protein [Nanoarchaeota archaeon]|nr:DUF2341 domain-containing protein [Nanoarchaeota archaeon]